MLLTGGEGGVGAVKLLDFGIAKFRGAQLLGEPTITGLERTEVAEGQEAPVVSGGALATSAGSVMGTPAYMAPEQVKNSSAVDKRADIYAIGIMLYEVLTGRRPFEAESSAELMGAHMYMQAEPPSKVVAKNNVADRALNWQKLDPVVMRALAKKPEERYQDCSALQTDLEAAWGQSFSIARGATLQAPAVSAPAVQSTPLASKKTARGKLVAAVGLATVLIVGGGAAAFFGGAGRSASEAQLARSEQIIQLAAKGAAADKRALLEAIQAVGGREHLPLVVQALADEDPTVSRAALQAVRAVGQPGDTQLAEPLSSLAGNAVGASVVEIAAAQLQIGETEALGVLSAMLRSPIPTAEVRLQAAVVLAKAGQLPAPALRQFLEAAIKAGMKQPTLRRDALVRPVLAKDAEALRQLEALAEPPQNSDDKSAHIEALQVLVLAKHKGAADNLRQKAKPLPPAERIDLLETLAEAEDPHAASLLLPLLHDPQPKVRRRALSALGSLAHKKLWKHPDKTLTPLLDDADGQVALLSAVTLWAERAATEQPQDAKHE